MSYYTDIFHGQCEHLFTDDIHSDDCVKRYFEVFDPYKEKVQRIVICNEYLKLLVRTKQYEKQEHTYYGSPFDNVMENVFDQYTVTKIHAWMERGSESNPTVRYTVCQRPHLCSQIRLFEAIRIITTWDYPPSIMHCNFRDRVVESVRRTAEYYHKYAKYKYQWIEIRRLIKGLDRYYNCFDEKIYKDLFLIFFEIQSSINTKFGIK